MKKINRIGGGIRIPECTKKGYAIAHVGDGVYINRPHQKRGVVQKGMIQTLKTSCDDVGVVVEDSTVNNPLKGKTDYGWHFEQNVYAEDSRCCRSIKSAEGSGNIPKLLINADGIYTNDSERFHKGPMKNLSRTLKANKHDAGVIENNVRIRKLTPLECWRLMGFTDEDFYKAAKVNSNSQLYKQAGNSIVKQVLMAIFEQML